MRTLPTDGMSGTNSKSTPSPLFGGLTSGPVAVLLVFPCSVLMTRPVLSLHCNIFSFFTQIFKRGACEKSPTQVLIKFLVCRDLLCIMGSTKVNLYTLDVLSV